MTKTIWDALLEKMKAENIPLVQLAVVHLKSGERVNVVGERAEVLGRSVEDLDHLELFIDRPTDIFLQQQLEGFKQSN